MKDPRYPVPQDVSLLPVLRSLHRCVQRVERVSAALAESHGLTISQCDVLFTLGDTEGLPFKEISEMALVSRGTLTPVLCRMEAKGLLRRCEHPTDRRQLIVKLTPEGQALYEATFLPMVDEDRRRLAKLAPEEQAHLKALLDKLAAAFE